MVGKTNERTSTCLTAGEPAHNSWLSNQADRLRHGEIVHRQIRPEGAGLLQLPDADGILRQPDRWHRSVSRARMRHVHRLRTCDGLVSVAMVDENYYYGYYGYCYYYEFIGRWATGVTTFHLATGRLPFQRFRTQEELHRLIAAGYYRWPRDKLISAPLQEFVNALMQKKPSGERVSFE